MRVDEQVVLAAGLAPVGGVRPGQLTPLFARTLTLSRLARDQSSRPPGPYRHFSDKDDLLAVVAQEAWEELEAEFRALRGRQDPTAAPTVAGEARTALRTALQVIIDTSRRCPPPVPPDIHPGRPDVARRPGRRTREQVYLDLVTAVVGEAAAGQYGGLLLTSVHGLIGFDFSGFLGGDKWSTADELLDLCFIRLPSVDEA